MANDELTTRVTRFLAGEGDARNLDRIFSLLRFRSHGRAAFRDIADFAAHSDLRDRGVTFEGAQNLATVIEFVVPRMGTAKQGVTLPSTKKEIENFAQASFTITPEHNIVDKLGLSKDKAGVLLKKGLSKIKSYDGKNWDFHSGMTQPQHEVLSFFINHLRLHSIFNHATLIDDLCEVLVAEKLIQADSEAAVRDQSARVAQFAIEKMNGVQIKLPSTKIGDLRVGLGAGDKLFVFAIVPNVVQIGPNIVSISAPAFVSDNNADDWVTPNLLENLKMKYQLNPVIELQADWKLDLLS